LFQLKGRVKIFLEYSKAINNVYLCFLNSLAEIKFQTEKFIFVSTSKL
jgi:hypothetical protein